jgi:hypothetical protein
LRLCLGIPSSSWERVPIAFLPTYTTLIMHLMSGRGPVTHLDVTFGDGVFPTDAARNHIVRKFLASKGDALFFLDADHRIEEHTIDRLIACDKSVVTARYHIRFPPYHPTAYVEHPLAPDGQFKPVHYGQGVFEVDRCGAGALLIRRPVLEAIGSDWFRYQRDTTPGHEPDFTVTEDFWFCEQAHTAGFGTWIDWDTVVDHQGEPAWINGSHFDAYLGPMAEAMTADIASGLVSMGTTRAIDVGGFTVTPHRAAFREAGR